VGSSHAPTATATAADDGDEKEANDVEETEDDE
jgi:hypothetical protein